MDRETIADKYYADGMTDGFRDCCHWLEIAELEALAARIARWPAYAEQLAIVRAVIQNKIDDPDLPIDI